MTTSLTNYVVGDGALFDGIIGIGGSGGTALITPAMRALRPYALQDARRLCASPPVVVRADVACGVTLHGFVGQ